MKIDPNGAFGNMLTFLSVAILLVAFIAGFAAAIYAAFWLNSALMMGVCLMVLLALPIMWLEYSK